MTLGKFIEASPVEDIEDEEFYGLLLDFSTYVCLKENKKMNFPSIFVAIISDEDILGCYMDFCGFDDKREALLAFMRVDDSVIRSKYLKKVINNA
jgi:hypothetical protein